MSDVTDIVMRFVSNADKFVSDMKEAQDATVNFGKKLPTSKAEKFSKNLVAMGKAGAGLAAVFGTATIAVNKMSDAVDSAITNASDFNKMMDEDVRAALIGTGETFGALSAQSEAAQARLAGSFAQMVYHARSSSLKIQEAMADWFGSDDAVVTDDDLEQARSNLLAAGKEFEAAASNFMGGGTFVPDGDKVLAEAQRLANERAQQERDLNYRLQEINIETMEARATSRVNGEAQTQKKLLELELERIKILSKLDPNFDEADSTSLVTREYEAKIKALEAAIQANEDMIASNKKAEDQRKSAADKQKKDAEELKRIRTQDQGDAILQSILQNGMEEAELRAHLHKLQLEELDDFIAKDSERRELYEQGKRDLQMQYEADEAKRKKDHLAQLNMDAFHAADQAFADGKANAIRTALLATQEGIAQALKLPVPENLAAAATAAANGASVVSSIKGIAHSGLDYVPSEGTYLLDEGEMVLNKQDAQAVRSGDGLGGGGDITINPTLHSNGLDGQTTNQLMNQMVTRIINDVRSNGPIMKSIRGYS